MRALLQRVTEASVAVDGAVTGRIGAGLLVLLGVSKLDTEADVDFVAAKILNLRIFEDDAGKMNLALSDVGGALLVISQFTLYGDATAGRRPSFLTAAPGSVAEPLYTLFVTMLRERGCTVETGEFGAMSEVELVNDGPTTIWLER